MMSMRCKVVLTSMAVVSGILWGGCQSTSPKVFAVTKTDSTRMNVVGLSSFVRRYAEGQLPTGEVGDLELWMSRLVKRDRMARAEIDSWVASAGSPVIHLADGRVELLDCWGKKIIYRCPSDDDKYVYRLYSTGPNGVDEGGKGDDIEGSSAYFDPTVPPGCYGATTKPRLAPIDPE